MFTPIGFFASQGPFIPSYSPFAYYDGLNTTDSVDSVNKTWSDIALVNTTDDSTFDTDVNGGGLPDWNSNGYWHIESNTATGTGKAFRYSTATNTTNPFSFIIDNSFTILNYVRIDAGDNDNDIIGCGTVAGAILIGTGDVFGRIRAHAWVSTLKTTDTPASSISAGTWFIVGMRFTSAGASSRLDAIISTINGTVSITNGATFTPGAVSSAPREMGIGTRGNDVRGNADHAAYVLYKTALSDSQIQDVCDELSGRFGNPA